uniref:Uncharacterized protein n=1 Tax=Rhipicephalus microplus TaxID=6941 RepID=A0A6G5A2F9_RHIMP
MLQRVGACFGGTCQERPPERPPKQIFKKRECKVEDVQVTPELIVAGGCRATCRRYETEDRLNGTLCFRHYTRDTFGWFKKEEPTILVNANRENAGTPQTASSLSSES